MCRRVSLLGGSFDPVHHGHLIVARAVAEAVAIDEVVLLPAGRAPHKPGGAVASGADRAAMVRLAVEGDGLFSVSDHDLDRRGPCYTVDTVRHFRGELDAGDELIWIIGGDSLVELHEWYQPGQIASMCRIVTAARSGFEPGGLEELRGAVAPEAFEQIAGDILETPRIDISATQIRRRVAEGRSIRNLTPPAVADYIAAKGLYRALSQ